MKYCQDKDCETYWDEENPESNCQCGNPNYKKCEYYIGERTGESEEPSANEVDTETLFLPWHSNAMGSLDAEWINSKRQPFIIGVVGNAEAGKSTLLANLYMLMRNGKNIGDYAFSGSYTLLGWERLAHFLSFHTHKRVSFPPHTSSNNARIPGLLHLLLKDKNGQFQDVLFTDAPGEWFTNWSDIADADESKGAKWINENADAFIIVADSKAFNESQSKARPLFRIVSRMRDTHNMRPTALVWAKSDISIDAQIKAVISEKIITQLPNTQTYDVAVINHDSEDLSLNVLKLVNQLLTEQYDKKNELPEIAISNPNDFFFTIRLDSYARKK